MAQECCRHHGCTCAAKSDGYCSPYCASDVAGADEEKTPCACGHDECDTPTKFESRAAISDMAPEGRFPRERPARDW